jgi:glucose-1-phosphate adenylyltransferase
MDRVSAMIMAGGKGQRMGELCDSKPKPALPFAGSYRVIDFTLSNCLNSQIYDIAVLTGYQSSYLGSYLKRWLLANAPDKNIAILDPEKGMYLGTADAVYQNLSWVSGLDAETVLVLAADHVYQMDYRRMIAFHNYMKADVTVGVFPVPLERASQFGLVKVDSGSQVIDFVEKPARPESNLASMGIYVFSAGFLKERLIADAANPNSVHDFGRVLLPQMVGSDRVYSYQFSGYWQDIGTPEAYHQANLDLVYRNSALSLNGLWPIYPCDKDFRPDNIQADSHVKNSLIGPGCSIEGYVENSILSAGVRVEEGAVVKDSVIMANVSIGRHTHVSYSIMDEGAVTGEHCIVGSGPDSYYRPAGVTILGQRTRLQAHSCVGANSAKVPQPVSRVSSGFERLPQPAMS